jgi:hypothetical protein
MNLRERMIAVAIYRGLQGKIEPHRILRAREMLRQWLEADLELKPVHNREAMKRARDFVAESRFEGRANPLPHELPAALDSRRLEARQADQRQEELLGALGEKRP